MIAKLEICRLKKTMNSESFRVELQVFVYLRKPSSRQFRGMDTALSKLMPDLRSLKQPSYRMLRKKMQIFEKACQARGQLMMLNPLEGDNCLAMEDLSLDRFDTMKAFDELFMCLIATINTILSKSCRHAWNYLSLASTILSKSCRHAWNNLSLDSIASVPNHCVSMFVDLMLWSSSCGS